MPRVLGGSYEGGRFVMVEVSEYPCTDPKQRGNYVAVGGSGQGGVDRSWSNQMVESEQR